jgi:hypothetical protein
MLRLELWARRRAGDKRPPLALTILVWLLMVTFLWLALIRDRRVAS